MTAGSIPIAPSQLPAVVDSNSESVGSDEEKPWQPVINVYYTVEGHVVDNDSFARDIVPSIKKAIEDGV